MDNLMVSVQLANVSTGLVILRAINSETRCQNELYRR